MYSRENRQKYSNAKKRLFKITIKPVEKCWMKTRQMAAVAFAHTPFTFNNSHRRPSFIIHDRSPRRNVVLEI